jgi:hypothetical protein
MAALCLITKFNPAPRGEAAAATARGGEEIVHLESGRSTAERAQDEIRQLEHLGQAITTALESTLIEPLPSEIILLLSILESKGKGRVKLIAPIKFDQHDR